MKRSILLFVFLFAALLQVSAQKTNCSDSQPRPVYGEQRPCPGTEEIYYIEKAPGYSVTLWEVPRAFAGEGPVGWTLIGPPLASEHATAYPESEYFAMKVLVGKKPGTMKVTVSHPECGTKVGTLPVMPGISFEIVVTAPEEPHCIGEPIQFNSSINIKQTGQNSSSFTYIWHYPAGWTVVGQANQSNITLIPTATPGSVWVEVDDVNNKPKNGNGLGPRGYCSSASNQVVVVPIDCNPCPAISTADDAYKISYLGSEMNWETPSSWPTTTVSFKIEALDGDLIDEVFIALTQVFPTPPVTLAVTSTVDEAGYSSSFNGFNEISYTKAPAAAGSSTLTVHFTVPTGYFIELYGITIFDVGAEEGFISGRTTYRGTVEGERICNFGPLESFAVELSSFHGKAIASGVELNWTTASEENNDRFEVQRSTDGKNFKTIGTVKGAGNSATALRYSYLDKNASKGTSYYRLNQVDTDGTASLSQVIAMENNSATATAGLSIYPNPATGDKLTITFDGNNMSNKTYVITISDINGRKVFEQNMSGSDNSEINLSIAKLKMSNGLYMIKVQGDNMVETRKLLINK